MSGRVNGRFAKGNKFGKGRIKGSRNWATIVKRHLRSHEPDTAAILVNDQLERGRRWAMSVIVGMLPKGGELPIELDMSAIQTMADVLGAQNVVMSTVAQGRITTGDAQKLMRRLDRRCAALLGRQ
jgi:hypothetical protein